MKECCKSAVHFFDGPCAGPYDDVTHKTIVNLLPVGLAGFMYYDALRGLLCYVLAGSRYWIFHAPPGGFSSHRHPSCSWVFSLLPRIQIYIYIYM